MKLCEVLTDLPGLAPNDEELSDLIEDIVRREWGRVLAALMGTVRDLALAEDALQDACVAALQDWPVGGLPSQPRAWLLRTARNKAIDRFRREANFATKQAELEVLAELERQAEPETTDEAIEDDRLAMVFTCCHPALAEPARVALTLRIVGGISTPETARAFLVSERTMAQRLVRTLCPECKTEQEVSKEYLLKVDFPPTQISTAKFVHGVGCDVCGERGYQGRTGIYELLQNSEAIQQLVIDSAAATLIGQQARSEGMLTLRDYGWDRALAGVTSIEEVLRVTQAAEDPEAEPKENF